MFKRSTIERKLRRLWTLLALLASIALVCDIWNTYQVSMFAYPLSMKIKEVWLPELPFLLLWVALIISWIKKWGYLLFLPIFAIPALLRETAYLIAYPYYISPFYVPAQLSALLGTLTITASFSTLILWLIYKFLTRRKSTDS